LRDTKPIKQVICINWGTKYGPPFINRLYAMAARNITPPFSFTCFTDNSAGVRAEVRCEPLPPLDVKMPVRTLGIWPKARLWGPALADLKGPVLFLDLDLVVVGNLDPFFEVGEPDDVILSRNPAKPFERLGQTSCFRFPVGKLLPLQELFRADPQGIADKYRFEQRFVTRHAPGGIKFFPRTWVRHFRHDCRRMFPLNYILSPRLPRGARVVIFPGGLHPQHAIEGRYGPHSPDNIRDHLKALGRKGGETPLNHLRHYIRPSEWVAQHWRE
jgi:hypothetical protein